MDLTFIGVISFLGGFCARPCIRLCSVPSSAVLYPVKDVNVKRVISGLSRDFWDVTFAIKVLDLELAKKR